MTFWSSSTVWPGRGVATIWKVRRQIHRLLERRDVLRDLQVVDEPLVQPRVLAAGQHVGDDVERRVARLEVPRRQPGQRQARQLHAIGDRLLLDAGQRDARNRHRLRRRARLHVAEPLLDELPRPHRIDVARDHEAGVRRRVVRLEEVDDVFVAGGGQVLHVADDRPVIRMAFRIEHLVRA